MEGSDIPKVEQRLWRYEPVVFNQLFNSKNSRSKLKRYVCNFDDPINDNYDNINLSIENLSLEDHPFMEKLPIQNAEMFFLKQQTFLSSVEDELKKNETAEAVETFLMELKPELLPRRGWCSRSIPKSDSDEIVTRCGYSMDHCKDYQRWKSADEVQFNCNQHGDDDNCTTAGYCFWDGTKCEVIQTNKSKECVKEQDNGNWEAVCEKTNFKEYTGAAIFLFSLIICSLILVSKNDHLSFRFQPGSLSVTNSGNTS